MSFGKAWATGGRAAAASAALMVVGLASAACGFDPSLVRPKPVPPAEATTDFRRPPTRPDQPTTTPLAAPPTAAVVAPARSSFNPNRIDCPPETPDFPAWLTDYRTAAIAAGVRPATADRSLRGVQRNLDIDKRDSFQPEFEKPVWEYLRTAVSDERVRNGRRKFAEHAGLLRRVEAQLGVAPEFIVAIWGLETAYGGFTGSFNTVEALANLAYTGRRRQFGCVELYAALVLIDQYGLAPATLEGSWAGATGQTQFLPSVIHRYGIDFNGDGQVNLWSDLGDVFASTANHLVQSGWQTDQPWGFEVRLPANFDYALAQHDDRRPVPEWSALGIRSRDGQSLPAIAGDAAVLVPAGHTGPAFLVFNNFRTIMRYNFSTSYALAVGLLADQIAGRPGLRATWPTHVRPLSRSEREDLQRLLSDRGYDVGEVDGIIGRQTRSALQQFQRDIGVPADGFATDDMLRQLRDG